MGNYKIEVATIDESNEINPSYVAKKFLINKENVVFLGLIKDGNNL